MLDSKLRKHYDKVLLDPLINRGYFDKVNPHLLTLIACLSGISAGLFLWVDKPLCAFLALFLSGFLDTVDGALARRQGLSSPKGAAIDIVSDRLVECSVVLGLFSVSPPSRDLLTLLMLVSVLICITSFLVVGIFSPKESEKSFHYSPGLMERTEAFLFFAAMILLPGYFAPLSILFSVLVFLTGLTRIRQFVKGF